MQSLSVWKPTGITCVATGALIIASMYIFRKLHTRHKSRLLAPKPVVSRLIVYPIKGCRGIERYSVELTESGMKDDREFALVILNNDRCTALSVTKYPRLVLIEPTLPTDLISVKAPGMSDLTIPITLTGKEYILDYYGDSVSVFDQGDISSVWFSSFLNVNVRLVKISRSVFLRSPILIISDSTLLALSSQVGHHIEYARFRPNILLANLSPFQEDHCGQFQFGNEVSLNVTSLCDRCSVPGVDTVFGVLSTSLVGKLRRLRTIGFDISKWCVGVYAQPEIPAGEKRRVFVGQETSFLLTDMETNYSNIPPS